MDWLLIAVILPVGYLVLRILETIVLNVVGNILTDPVKNLLAHRALSSRGKRIDQLREEYERVTAFFDDRNKFILYVIQNGLYLFALAFFTLLTLIAFGIEINTRGDPFWVVFFTVVFSLSVIAGAIIWNSINILVERIAKYDTYKMQVEKRILELSKGK